MLAKDLQTLFDYSYSANAKLFAVIRQLTTEEFTRDVAGSYGSVQNTLVHTLSAEWGWMDRCGGLKRGPALKAIDCPTADALIEKWTAIESHMRAFLAGLSDADLERPIEWAIGDGPKHTMQLGHLMHHAANHGVHHRGQVALLLRGLGHTPGNFDLLFYYPGGQ